ncbi:hypothetical protein [Aciditerrimonas ferrireducens]|uniref:hypothetical protein n=1 Tax=Aciditerrimonas ferrireducens TaxID=667306 RepID=UPI002002E8FD|nr:hypothetical protein [Aciditerrimonas ferrireducens]MCK4176200.1 hypothetical protein [Aciditerrimonas ferrireducens]
MPTSRTTVADRQMGVGRGAGHQGEEDHADVAFGHRQAQLPQGHRLGGQLGLGHVDLALGDQLAARQAPGQGAGRHHLGGGAQLVPEPGQGGDRLDAHVGEQELALDPGSLATGHRNEAGHRLRDPRDEGVVPQLDPAGHCAGQHDEHQGHDEDHEPARGASPLPVAGPPAGRAH